MRGAVVGLAAVATLAACGDDAGTTSTADATATVTVVEVAAQPCTRPTRDRGLGVVVAPDLVATAAHTVEGARRELTVNGAPAEVAALDARRDLALLRVRDVPGAPATLAGETPAPGDAATVRLPDGALDVTIVATGPLTVTNVSDDTRLRREVHTFEPGVDRGTSGAPLVDADGRVVGIVVIDRDDRDQAYATTSGELSGLLTDLAGDRSADDPENAIGCGS